MGRRIDHNVRLIPQPTPDECWRAALAMILGLPAAQYADAGDALVAPGGGLMPDRANMQVFARSWRLRLTDQRTLSEQAFVRMLRWQGPLMLCGKITTAHCVVIGGYDGGKLKLLDPFPAGVGRVVWVRYSWLLTRFPLAAVYILSTR